MPQSSYIIQRADKSICPHCHHHVDLLATDDDMLKALKRSKHWFYICWHCHIVTEIGCGEVKREE